MPFLSTLRMRPIATPAASAPKSKGSSSRPANKAQRSWRRPIVVALVSVAIVGVALVGYFASTTVEGTELHSGNWNVRRFHFRRDPFTNYQFTDIYYESVNRSSIWTASVTKDHSKLDAAIASHLSKQPNQLARWDLVEIADGSPTNGAAVILFELLQTYTASYDLHWVKWSQEYPKKAASLWPAIQSLTLLNLYTEIHPLLDLTREDLDDVQFDPQIDVAVQNTLLRFCENCGDEELASQAATIGLQYGENPRLSEYVRKPSF